MTRVLIGDASHVTTIGQRVGDRHRGDPHPFTCHGALVRIFAALQIRRMAAINETLAKIVNAIARIEDDTERIKAEIRQLQPASDPVDRSLTVPAAAQLLSCDESVVRGLVKSGDLRGHTVGRRGVCVYLSSIEQYRDLQAIEPTKNEPKGLPVRRRRMSKAHEAAMAQLRAAGTIVDDGYGRTNPAQSGSQDRKEKPSR